jgi:ribosome-associated protein
LPSAKQTALDAARIADEHKVQDLKLLDLKGLFVADYFVIATILNRQHGRAVAEAIMDAARAAGGQVLGVEGLEDGTWVLVDLGDVLVHLFEAEYRRYYDLELLWGDARKVPVRALGKKKRAGAQG